MAKKRGRGKHVYGERKIKSWTRELERLRRKIVISVFNDVKFGEYPSDRTLKLQHYARQAKANAITEQTKSPNRA